MSFNSVAAAGQAFAENAMGETLTHTSTLGVATSGLVGVFNQVTEDFVFNDFSTKKVTRYIVVSSKPQWGAVVPTKDDTITDSSGTNYTVSTVNGARSAGEPAYELSMNRLT